MNRVHPIRKPCAWTPPTLPPAVAVKTNEGSYHVWHEGCKHSMFFRASTRSWEKGWATREDKDKWIDRKSSYYIGYGVALKECAKLISNKEHPFKVYLLLPDLYEGSSLLVFQEGEQYGRRYKIGDAGMNYLQSGVTRAHAHRNATLLQGFPEGFTI